MSSTTIVTTWADLYTALLNDMRTNTSAATSLALAKRYIDTAHKRLYMSRGEKFSWAERRAFITTHPQYTTGTIAATVGSPTITGTSTAWTTNNDYGQPNMREGGKLVIGGDARVIYRVVAVGGAGTATISPNFIGDTDSGLGYVYFEDEYDLASDFLKPVDAQSFSDDRHIRLVGRLDLRKYYPRNWVVSESIRWSTIIDEAPDGNTTRIRRVRFAPPPSNAQVIPYTYVTNKTVTSAGGVPQVSFTADTDEPIMPLEFREAIVLAAKVQWYRDLKDDNRSLEATQDLAGMMQEMLSDEDLGSTTMRVQGARSSYDARARNPWRGGARYDTNGKFDRFEQ